MQQLHKGYQVLIAERKYSSLAVRVWEAWSNVKCLSSTPPHLPPGIVTIVVVFARQTQVSRLIVPDSSLPGQIPNFT